MKLLIISHNCVSNNNNMGKAISSSISFFKKEELCQLYIYPSLPDVDLCNSYYRITDKEVFKSIFSLKKYGCEIDKNLISDRNLLYESESDKKIYNRKKSIIKILLRDYIWKYSNYFNKKLEKWLLKEKPQYILLFPGKNCFIYDIAIKISNKYKIPIITYYMDNYYNLSTSDFFERIHQNRLNNKIKKIYNYSKINITLSDEMNLYYSKEFQKKAFTIMLGSIIKKQDIKNLQEVKILSYFGNMSYKRYQMLIEIGQALYNINKRLNKNYCLNIYANIFNDNIIKMFKNVASINYMGYVKGDDYNSAIDNTDILIHVESFDSECKEKTKYSVSTKISQIITSGICALAYGPSDVASIGYLKRTKSAFIIDNKEDLENKLNQLFNNKDLRNKIIENGFISAKKNQDALINSKKIYELILKVEE